MTTYRADVLIAEILWGKHIILFVAVVFENRRERKQNKSQKPNGVPNQKVWSQIIRLYTRFMICIQSLEVFNVGAAGRVITEAVKNMYSDTQKILIDQQRRLNAFL